MHRLLFLLGAPALTLGILGLVAGPLYGDDMTGEAMLILALGVFIFATAWFLT
jgi:hypothetical protein